MAFPGQRLLSNARSNMPHACGTFVLIDFGAGHPSTMMRTTGTSSAAMNDPPIPRMNLGQAEHARGERHRRSDRRENARGVQSPVWKLAEIPQASNLSLRSPCPEVGQRLADFTGAIRHHGGRDGLFTTRECARRHAEDRAFIEGELEEAERKNRQNNPPICVVGGVTVWSRKRGRCRVRCRCERRRFAVEVTRFGAAGNDGSVSGRGWAAGRR